MADTDKKTETNTEPEPKQPKLVAQPEDDQEARVAQCIDELNEVLKRHRCQIVPMFAGENVGQVPGKKLLLEAVYHVIPMS